MNEQRAREILGDRIKPDNRLYDGTYYVCWPAVGGPQTVVLDSEFDADDLEAIAWWMRNMKVTARAP